MRPEPKKRVPIAAPQAPLGGLEAAFSKLKLPELPTGPAPAAAPSLAKVWKMGRVVLRRETARRGGKTVVVVNDFASHLPISVIEGLAKKLRAGCGCGGTVRERRIEIQGEQVSKLRELLELEGFEVRGVR